MLKKALFTALILGTLGFASVANAGHMHVFPSIDKPDQDMILVRDYFVEDLSNDVKYCFTNGTIGYRLDFAGPGGFTNTQVSPHIYIYVPGTKTTKSKILRLTNKTGAFNITRAFKMSEYTPKEDKQVPMFLEVLDNCFQEQMIKQRK